MATRLIHCDADQMALPAWGNVDQPNPAGGNVPNANANELADLRAKLAIMQQIQGQISNPGATRPAM